MDKQLVSGIEFYGNIAVANDELMNVINLKKPGLFHRSEFNPKRLNRDVINLKAYYKSKGYLEIEVKGEYIRIPDDYVDISFHINEGNQYFLQRLDLSGNKSLSDEEILGFLNVSLIKPYNPVYLRKQLKSLKRKYLQMGKLDIAIMDEVSIEGNNVTIRINISPGTTYFINEIYINGLETIKEKYVFRELVFESKDMYNIEKIDKSRSRIFDSGLFSSVVLIPKKPQNTIGQVDIEIKVREYKSSSIEANFGFKELTAFQDNLTTTGIDVGSRWLIGNIFNTSSNIEISGRLSSSINLNIFTEEPLVEKDLSIALRSPWTFYFRLPFRIKYFHSEESEQYRLVRDGVTYSIYFNRGRSTRYEINSTVEIIQSEDKLYTAENREPARWINVKYLSNKIQEPLNPRGGHYLSISSSLYGTILGGDRHFYKLESEFRKYINLLSNRIFAYRIFLGYIDNLDEFNELPVGYRFQLGGQTSLRGWSSPREFELPQGALISEMINLEYRFQIINKFGGEIFFDGGRLYNHLSLFKDTHLSWNYGLGLTFHSTLGPIRVDVGFPYGDLNYPQPHVSLLYMF